MLDIRLMSFTALLMLVCTLSDTARSQYQPSRVVYNRVDSTPDVLDQKLEAVAKAQGFDVKQVPTSDTKIVLPKPIEAWSPRITLRPYQQAMNGLYYGLIVVSETGKVSAVIPLLSTNPSLNTMIEDQIYLFKYTPAQYDSKPVSFAYVAAVKYGKVTCNDVLQSIAVNRVLTGTMLNEITYFCKKLDEVPVGKVFVSTANEKPISGSVFLAASNSENLQSLRKLAKLFLPTGTKTDIPKKSQFKSAQYTDKGLPNAMNGRNGKQIDAYVVMFVVVNSDGLVASSRVVATSDLKLGFFLEDYLLTYKFKPAMVNDQPAGSAWLAFIQLGNFGCSRILEQYTAIQIQANCDTK